MADDGDKFSYHVQNMTYDKVISSDEPPTFRVNLTFFCNYIQHDIDTHNNLSYQYTDPVSKYSVNLNLHHVSEVPKARETIQEKLSSWKLSDDELGDLSTYTVQEIAKLTSSCAELGFNVLNLDLQVTLENTDEVVPYDDDDVERDIAEFIIHEDDEWLFTVLNFISGPVESGMVPATDESINFLKHRRLMDSYKSSKPTRTVDETCVICLEEFSEACDIVCLPCEHEFHGNCVEQWLKISHYCPTCRFEMPTN